jgi:putative endonuclease
VARHYEALGYRVIDRNWHCREGELDLVLRKGRLMVFCEVKTRTTDAFGVPAEAVTRAKQDKVRHAARRYLQDPPFRPLEVRFDVAAVMGDQVELIQGAF